MNIVKRPAVHRTLFFDIPETLVINVKRYSLRNGFLFKDHDQIELEKVIYLDKSMVHRVQRDNYYQMKMYKDQNNSKADDRKSKDGKYKKKFKYYLFAIICHIGEYSRGHYILYLRYRYHDSDHWVLFDGNTQIKMPENLVFKQAQGVY